MAPNSIFKWSLMFCRNRFPVQGFAVAACRFRLQHQWFCTTTLTGSSDASTVSYLIHSCGLSPEAAIEASHKVKLQSLLKPDSVLALLKEYEFTDAQISTLVRRRPRFILVDAKKTLLPKLEFLSSIGISRLDLARVVTSNPSLLERSLANSIVPCYTFLKSAGLSDILVANAWKHGSYIFRVNLAKNVIPNIGFMREMGMPQSCIGFLLAYYAHIVVRKPEFFSQLVGEVQQLGFDPHKSSFVQAMQALCGKGTTWKRCHEAYRSWDWSDNDILSAFKLFPLCMTKSEKKIMKTMDFLVNKMGWESGKVAKYPMVLCFSLEKRIIPRWSVVKVLLLKGLIKEENLSLATVFATSDKYFLTTFVTRYLNQEPQLLNVYQGKLDVHKVT